MRRERRGLWHRSEGWGLAERSIEWGERRMRLSPFDPWAFAAFGSLALGHFQHGRYEEAADAAYKAVQSNPAHSINHVRLAAPLVKLGRLEEAKAAAARVLDNLDSDAAGNLPSWIAPRCVWPL
jgi:tetratricopeptide (TPR) repeat protein